MAVPRRQVEAFEVLFSNRKPTSFTKLSGGWVLRGGSDGALPLHLLGVTKTCTSGKPVAVFGFAPQGTEAEKSVTLDAGAAYHFALLTALGGKKVLATEIVPEKFESGFRRTENEVEYIME